MRLEAIKNLMLYKDNKMKIVLIKNVENQYYTKYKDV